MRKERIGWWLCAVVCLIPHFSLAVSSDSSQHTVKPGIHFSKSDIEQNNADPQQTTDILNALTNSWHDYLQLDREKYGAFLSEDVIRHNQRFGQIQRGRAQVLQNLNREWEFFERPGGVISEQLEASHIRLTLAADHHTARISYQLDAVGGSRWHYTDEAMVFEILVKENSKWKLAYYSDVWGLDLSTATYHPAKPFEFDFVYPVRDLTRAIHFYTPLLGEPVFVDAHEAQFQLLSGNFILDNQTVKTVFEARSEMPNGHAIFYVSDLSAERERLKSLDVKLIRETEEKFEFHGTDPYFVGLDSEGNVFQVQQKVFDKQNSESNSHLAVEKTTLAPSLARYQQSAVNMADAWMKRNLSKIAEYCQDSCIWFDDTQHVGLGLIKGGVENLAILNQYWNLLDSNAKGILADINLSNFYLKTYGDFTLVSYQRTMHGRGHHPFKQEALVTQLFRSPTENIYTFISNTSAPEGRVRDVDYSGYPTTDIKSLEKFYRYTLKLGKPYHDTDWRGFWGRGWVFGIFLADKETDHVPEMGASNGYLSLWVKSASETYDYLNSQKVSFPVIPAINSVAGVDVKPGYTQVASTDSEGNMIVFSEYTGRRNH